VNVAIDYAVERAVYKAGGGKGARHQHDEGDIKNIQSPPTGPGPGGP
jgi:hypothetical protein